MLVYNLKDQRAWCHARRTKISHRSFWAWLPRVRPLWRVPSTGAAGRAIYLKGRA